MSDEQGRIEAAARDWWEFDQGRPWIDPNGDQLYRQGYRDDTRRVLAAADRWDREHGYVRASEDAIRATVLEDAKTMPEFANGNHESLAGWVAAVLRAAGEDQ